MTMQDPTPGPDSARASTGEREEMTVFDLLNIILQHRRLFVLLPLTLAVTAAIYSLLQPRTWTADTAFMPQSTDGRSALSGMAAQFGIQVGANDPGSSPAFYEQLVTSRSVLQSLVDSTYAVVRSGESVRADLTGFFAVKPGRQAWRREVAAQRLRGALSVSTSAQTGIVRLSVTTPYPELSQQIASGILAAANEFNLEKRQMQAAAERRFVEARLTDARTELAQAQRALQAFLERNRQFRESPQLQLESERLQSEAALRAQLVISLAEAYERARIEEVRNLPLITVIDPPARPLRPNGRGTVMRMLIAAVIGLGLALAISFLRAFSLPASAGDRSDVRLFQALLDETVTGIVPAWLRRRRNPDAG
jgi:uncharacterized protein involved in exopolysaccharide biosynthesis